MKFRHLVAVYETLKDKKKREIYDRVLVEGLPDWRMPIFYYRRMRKIGLVESLAYLFVIVTVFQYFINWAAYWEKNYSMSEQLATQMKKIQKNAAKNKIDKEPYLNDICKFFRNSRSLSGFSGLDIAQNSLNLSHYLVIFSSLNTDVIYE